METASYRLVLEEDMDLSALRSRIDEGYKFVVFRYNIGILFGTFDLFSPAILVPPATSMSSYARLYNTITLLVGWISIPVGPLTMANTIAFNQGGGVNVTSDVMLNIDEASLAERCVSIVKTNSLFSKPSKSDITEVQKAIKKDFEGDPNLKLLVFGWFINTHTPHYTIGLQVGENPLEYQEKVQKSLYRKFRKGTYFEFLFLDQYPREVGLLVAQGKVIYADQSVNLKEVANAYKNREAAPVMATDANTLKGRPEDL